MKKFFITTFGCQQNTADSERLTSFYASRGFAPADTLDDADILILNTCLLQGLKMIKISVICILLIGFGAVVRVEKDSFRQNMNST